MGFYLNFGRWPDGIIYYKNEFPKKDLILNRMKYIEDNSSITFQEVSNSDSNKNFLRIKTLQNSSEREGTRPGMLAGGSVLNLKLTNDEKKLSRKILHELCHVAGCLHEHQRSLRTTFIKVNKQNIITKQDQYDILKGFNYKEEGNYDFESITHYATGDNGNGNKIIEILDSSNSHYSNIMGTQDKLSQNDISTLKKMYK